jgi:DNA-binding response OmpR family regulator
MRRILVIDDDKAVRAAIAMALKANDFDVVVAESGRTGLEAFADNPFDLLIVDVFMPDMDGVKVIKAFRQKKADLPVVAISGVLLRSSGRTALDFIPMSPDLGRVTCLQKPFRPRELLAAVETAFSAVAA